MTDPIILDAIKVSQRQFREIATKIESDLIDECPVKKGALRDSITKERKSDTLYRIGVDSDKLRNDARNISHFDYSQIVVDGLDHWITIKVKNKKSLHWTKGGKDYFAYSVRIPPRKGNDFISRVANKYR